MSNKTCRYDTRIISKDVIVSNDSITTGMNNNDLIVGGSGSGKTGGYVIPNLQNAHNESLIISDTKNQLYKKYKKELTDRGYKVWNLDFVNPAKSMGYNPLQFIARKRDGSIYEKDILTVARALVLEDKSDEPIWRNSAISHVAFAIAYCIDSNCKELQSMITVADICRDVSSLYDTEILEWIDEHEDTFAAKKYREIIANRKADKMFSSIVGFVNVTMEIFSIRESSYIFHRQKSIDFNRIGK